jgi:hypothetical protein
MRDGNIYHTPILLASLAYVEAGWIMENDLESADFAHHMV